MQFFVTFGLTSFQFKDQNAKKIYWKPFNKLKIILGDLDECKLAGSLGRKGFNFPHQSILCAHFSETIASDFRCKFFTLSGAVIEAAAPLLSEGSV